MALRLVRLAAMQRPYKHWVVVKHVAKWCKSGVTRVCVFYPKNTREVFEKISLTPVSCFWVCRTISLSFLFVFGLQN